MTRLVVDASVTLAWCLKDEAGAHAVAIPGVGGVISNWCLLAGTEGSAGLGKKQNIPVAFTAVYQPDPTNANCKIPIGENDWACFKIRGVSALDAPSRFSNVSCLPSYTVLTGLPQGGVPADPEGAGTSLAEVDPGAPTTQ